MDIVGNQYGSSGRPSKSFQNGSNTHHGASRSQSGNASFGQKPKPQRGNGGGRSSGPSIGEILFGPGPRSTSHGGSKKNRNKGKGSR
ncbi:TPA: hypothetical protein DDX46_03375 [Candidatus Saccharibacteria bacterium]|nr:MAG: hypothetical protein A2791_04925 [Candidatus Saccharibacteria bacterium RIFCSPHIGHO2_01_FULL_46_30]HBH77759.1 hypothetical protein [Candidatus Saccharibacteria bacterium]